MKTTTTTTTNTEVNEKKIRTVKIDEDIAFELKKIAVNNKITLQNLLDGVLRDYLEKNNSQK